MRPSMHRPDLAPPSPRAGRPLRHVLLWGSVALVATGLAFLALHSWFPQKTPFGAQPHPAAAWLLRLHGILAWLLVGVGGAVWQAHVRPAWRTERRRWTHHRHLHGGALRALTGVFTAAGMAALLLTAIGLQYAPEDAHETLSELHWIIGVMGAATAVWHFVARHHHRRPSPRRR